ncbi:MAG: hypothetical protein ACPG44_04270 [Polaribacter sp.]
MKHFKNGQDDPKNKDDYQVLNAIKELIKTKLFREEGFEKLLQIDADTLSIKNQVFYYYIKGKYYVLNFSEADTKDLEVIYRADDCYTDMVAIAYHNNHPIKDAKFHFARGYCKLLIFQEHTSKDVKAKLRLKIEKIAGRILNYQPDNGSFIWLLSQLPE